MNAIVSAAWVMQSYSNLILGYLLLRNPNSVGILGVVVSLKIEVTGGTFPRSDLTIPLEFLDVFNSRRSQLGFGVGKRNSQLQGDESSNDQCCCDQPQCESASHFFSERPKHGSLIRERCLDLKLGIRNREVNQLATVSGLPSLSCSPMAVQTLTPLKLPHSQVRTIAPHPNDRTAPQS